MYVTENSGKGLCIVLENTGDIAKCLNAFQNYTKTSHNEIPCKVIEALEEELAE